MSQGRKSSTAASHHPNRRRFSNLQIQPSGWIELPQRKSLIGGARSEMAGPAGVDLNARLDEIERRLGPASH
jgi:hypothetical protein